MIIEIALGIFLLLEFFNVLALYLSPETQKANAMGAFTVWDTSKNDEGVHLLLRYMVNWVAGTKVIFIGLLSVINILGDESVKIYALVILVLAILTYYWKLMPLINEMDQKGLISPPGYSKTLTMMITLFVVTLSLSGIINYLLI